MIGTLSMTMMTASRMDAFTYPMAPSRRADLGPAPATGSSWVARLFGRAS